MKTGISVIICCYNSEEKISQTLEYLSNQVINSNFEWEVILVDNASTDSTSKVAYDVWHALDSGTQLTLVSELTPGLSNARNTGIANAKYEYLIFCDDDNWLDKYYVQTAFDIMQSNKKIGALGGRSEISSDSEIPFWFSSYQNSFAVGVQSLSSGDVSSRGYLWGAGIVIRKSTYELLYKAGFRFMLSGRKGKSITSGEDSELCKWLLLTGHKLWYDERLFFKHFIPKERLSKEYCINLMESFNLCYPIIRMYDSVIQKQINPQSRVNKVITFILSLSKLFYSILLRSKPYQEAILLSLELNNIFPFLTFNREIMLINRACHNFKNLQNRL